MPTVGVYPAVWDDLKRYLESVLQDTLATLDRSTPEERYFFQLALLHEDMHTKQC